MGEESTQEARRDAGAEPAAKARRARKARVSPASAGRNEQERYCRGRGDGRVRERRRG